MRRVGLVVDQVAVTSTPVDTGRARSNWIVTSGEPSTDQRTQGFDKGGETSLSQGRSEIAKYDVARGPLFITNNVPYIERLENGSSAQAPSGMLSAAIQAGIATAKGERVRIKIR